MRPVAPAALVLLVAAGCGAHALPPDGPSPARRTAEIALHVLVPKARPQLSRAWRHQNFISASTSGLAVAVYAHGTRASAIATVTADIASGSPLCTNGASGRACTVKLPALAPHVAYDFVVSNYDRAPVGGGFSGAKELGVGVATATLTAGSANAISVTISGIVASLSFAALTPFPAIGVSTQTATVSALDPDGNVIVSDAYVDASGNPMLVRMSADATAPGAVTFSPSSFSSPPNGVGVRYSSAADSASQLQNGFSTVLTATPSNGVASASATLSIAAPSFSSSTIPTGNSGPMGLVLGPDGAVWFVENAAAKIGRITTGGTIDEYPTISPSSAPDAIAVGSDGALWFTEFGTGSIGRIPTDATPGSSAQIAEFSGSGAGSDPTGIASGAGGDLWFAQSAASANAVTRMTLQGVTTTFGIPSAGSDPVAMSKAPDGSVWFVESAGNAIARTSPNGTITEFSIPTAASAPSAIAPGPDEAMWFTEYAGNNIGRIPLGASSSSQISEYPIPTSGAEPAGIALGPDGAMWFTEFGASNVGRIPTTAVAGSGSSILEFQLPGKLTGPGSIVTGSDGALWFAEVCANVIGRLQ